MKLYRLDVQHFCCDNTSQEFELKSGEELSCKIDELLQKENEDISGWKLWEVGCLILQKINKE